MPGVNSPTKESMIKTATTTKKNYVIVRLPGLVFLRSDLYNKITEEPDPTTKTSNFGRLLFHSSSSHKISKFHIYIIFSWKAECKELFSSVFYYFFFLPRPKIEAFSCAVLEHYHMMIFFLFYYTFFFKEDHARPPLRLYWIPQLRTSVRVAVHS